MLSCLSRASSPDATAFDECVFLHLGNAFFNCADELSIVIKTDCSSHRPTPGTAASSTASRASRRTGCSRLWARRAGPGTTSPGSEGGRFHRPRGNVSTHTNRENGALRGIGGLTAARKTGTARFGSPVVPSKHSRAVRSSACAIPASWATASCNPSASGPFRKRASSCSWCFEAVMRYNQSVLVSVVASQKGAGRRRRTDVERYDAGTSTSMMRYGAEQGRDRDRHGEVTRRMIERQIVRLFERRPSSSVRRDSVDSAFVLSSLMLERSRMPETRSSSAY
jgi:hypothetical protein